MTDSKIQEMMIQQNVNKIIIITTIIIIITISIK